MAFCFWISLAFYARGNTFVLKVSAWYQVIAWSLFMLVIVFTAKLWSSKYESWTGVPAPLRIIVWVAYAFFVLAAFAASVALYNKVLIINQAIT